MIYQELYAEAKNLVSGEQEEYALEKLTDKIRKINQQKMIAKCANETLDDLENDLANLLEHKIGYPNLSWRPLKERP